MVLTILNIYELQQANSLYVKRQLILFSERGRNLANCCLVILHELCKYDRTAKSALHYKQEMVRI